jgi:hypothetical protein
MVGNIPHCGSGRLDRTRLPAISLGFGLKLAGYGHASAINGRETEAPADRNQ